MHMVPAPLYLPEIARTEGLQLFARRWMARHCHFSPQRLRPCLSYSPQREKQGSRSHGQHQYSTA